MSSDEASASESILVVEDDDDLAEAMGILLTSENYAVTVVHGAEAGLAELRTGRHFLVLTDYSMPPGPTGAWMITEARREGLLANVQAIIVTASRQPDGVEGLCVLHKPVDIYQLLQRVRDALVAWRKRRRADDAVPATPAPARSPHVRIELALYISADSAASMRAQSNIDRVLQDYDSSAVALSLRDGASPEAEHDAISFTPTLVRLSPKPRHWLIGDLTNRHLLEQLLDDAGVPRKKREKNVRD